MPLRSVCQHRPPAVRRKARKWDRRAFLVSSRPHVLWALHEGALVLDVFQQLLGRRCCTLIEPPAVSPTHWEHFRTLTKLHGHPLSAAAFASFPKHGNREARGALRALWQPNLALTASNCRPPWL